jgi:hypothetical protein
MAVIVYRYWVSRDESLPLTELQLVSESLSVLMPTLAWLGPRAPAMFAGTLLCHPYKVVFRCCYD